MAVFDWHSPGTSNFHSTGKVEGWTNSIPPRPKVEPVKRPTEHACSNDKPDKDSSSLVAQPGEPQAGHPAGTSTLHASSVHRCISEGLESFPSGHNVSGDLVSGRSNLHINNFEMTAVKLALSHFDFPPKVPHPCCIRKHYCSGIHQQGGGNQVMVRLEGDRVLVLSGNITQSVHSCQVHSRQNECYADELSRAGQILPMQWSLHQNIVNLIFATRFSTKCVTFVSPTPNSKALDTDALAMSREGIFASCFPPPTNSQSSPPKVGPDELLLSHSGIPVVAKTSVVSNTSEPVQ